MNNRTRNYVTIVLLVGLEQIGCTSSSVVSSVPGHDRLSFAEFNLCSVAAANERMKIVFQDNSTLEGKGVRVERDSTSWLDPATGGRKSTQTALVKKVLFKRSAPGEGAGLGALVGAGVGLLGATISVANNKSEFAGIAWIVYPPVGAAFGAIVGVVAGLTKGHTDEYEFQNESEKR